MNKYIEQNNLLNEVSRGHHNTALAITGVYRWSRPSSPSWSFPLGVRHLYHSPMGGQTANMAPFASVIKAHKDITGLPSSSSEQQDLPTDLSQLPFDDEIVRIDIDLSSPDLTAHSLIYNNNSGSSQWTANLSRCGYMHWAGTMRFLENSFNLPFEKIELRVKRPWMQTEQRCIEIILSDNQGYTLVREFAFEGSAKKNLASANNQKAS